MMYYIALTQCCVLKAIAVIVFSAVGQFLSFFISIENTRIYDVGVVNKNSFSPRLLSSLQFLLCTMCNVSCKSNRINVKA
jgi:hypothetical protein